MSEPRRHAESAPHGARGLSAAELAAAVAELAARVVPSEVADVALRRGRDDLLLWLRPAAGGKVALHVVPGVHRGRITLTARRFAREDFTAGGPADALRARLAGTTLVAVDAVPGERIARLRFRAPDGGELTLVAELFGNRGLWLLLDSGGHVLALSRVPHARDRVLRPGLAYVPPPPRPSADDPAPRFQPPVLAAIDAHFTAADEHAEAGELRELCARALVRARASSAQKVAGLLRQRAQSDEAPALRARADLMLAYAATVPRGATSMTVPDPARDGAELTLPLQPDRPVVAQAQALYERARRLNDALAVVDARLAAARAEAEALDALDGRLARAETFADLDALRAELVARKLLAAPRPAAPRERARDEADAFRRFRSADGSEILCGRTNEQNERLTLRVARGNDVWLHVGRGYAGSHVVVRVPKGKTASLETLLDAATIAVHFSKARGADKAEAIYTQAKHVRRAKGAPPGTVIPHHTRTLFVRADEERLKRLLQSAAEP